MSENYKRPTKAIVTDAGDGTRCIPFTKDLPKGRLPLGGLSGTVETIAEECSTAGLDVILVTRPCDRQSYEEYFNHDDADLRQKLAKSNKTEQLARLDAIPKVKVISQLESLPYGNAAPIISCLSCLAQDESVIVCYGDDVTLGSSDVQTLLDAYDQHPDADAIIMAQKVDPLVVNKFGMIKLKDGNLLDRIVEKPNIGEEPSLLASYGRYLLTPKVLNALHTIAKGKGGEIWTVDAITQIAQTGKVYVELTNGHWMTTGDEYGYQLAFCEAAANQALQRGDSHFLNQLAQHVNDNLSRLDS